MTSQIIHSHPAHPPLSPIDTNKRRRRDRSRHNQQSYHDQNDDEAVSDRFRLQQQLLPPEYNGSGSSRNSTWGRNDLVAASSSSFHYHHCNHGHHDADHLCDNADISPNAPSASIGGKGEKYSTTNSSSQRWESDGGSSGGYNDYSHYLHAAMDRAGYEKNDAPEESIEPRANSHNNDNDNDGDDTKGTVPREVLIGSSSPSGLDFSHEQQQYDNTRAAIQYYHNGSNVNDAIGRYHHHQGRQQQQQQRTATAATTTSSASASTTDLLSSAR